MIDRKPRTIRKGPGLAAAVAAFLAAAALARVPEYVQDVNGFVSAKGERSIIMGYPGALEIWAYPLQLASDYRLRFRVAGTIEPFAAETLLRQVDRTSTEVVRTYVGPNFVVRERLFAPRQQAGTIVSYEVEGRPEVQLEVSFRPSLDLMWPAALGGRSVGWDATRSGYVEREPLHGFSATISSREAVAHDDTANSSRPVQDRLAMLLTPRSGSDGLRRAGIVFALDTNGADGAEAVRGSEATSRQDAVRHAQEVLESSIEIETPDQATNRALASAVLALDGAWACNDRLGCGVVGGYGPSRPDRRPQYAWFFAGDGLVATEGMLATGQFDRARQELAFITRYQDPKTGMIWHEMSQSAGFIDWVGRYPYMYVHVDITFQYLAAVRRYVVTTGDVAFARANRRPIEAAWLYCRSMIVADTGLPGIPPGKQGQNEQEDLRDDIRLSTLWVDAADGYADLAALLGDARRASGARFAAARARSALAKGGWDEANGFWLSGHRRDGRPVRDQRPDAIGILGQGVFSDGQAQRALDRLSTPDFVTRWGVRNLSAADQRYDPDRYGQGSVWGLGSASFAEIFWRRHRPLTGWAVWRGLAAGDTLDSAGHLHEVLAGNLYHAEYESVPEQTWSSAGLLTSVMRGLAGLDVDAVTRRVSFAPHLPPDWNGISVRRLRVGGGILNLSLRRDAGGVEIQVENAGAETAFEFEPMLPLGARIVRASIDATPAGVSLVNHPQDGHALLHMHLKANATTHAKIEYDSGMMVRPIVSSLRLGASSRDPVVEEVSGSERGLRVAVWIPAGGEAGFDITTRRRMLGVRGGTIQRTGSDTYRLTIAGGAAGDPRRTYVRQVAAITASE